MMESYEQGADGIDKLRDERQTALVALRSVCAAYLNGELSRHDLRSFHVSVSYNSCKQKEVFGDHPFFALEVGLEIAFREYFYHWDGTSWIERPDEVGFRDEVRRLTGHVSVNISTGTAGIAVFNQA